MEPVKLRVVKEYTDEEKEDAYEVYRDPKQGKRSFRRTGRLLEIPHQTVAHWAKVRGWQQRVWEEDERDARIMKQAVEMRMVNELDNLLDKAFMLAYEGTNNDKTQADMTKYLLGVMRVSPVQKVEQDIIDNRLVKREETTSTHELAGMATEDLAALLNQRLHALADGNPVDDNDPNIVDGEFTETS